jgi:hypothetical protein
MLDLCLYQALWLATRLAICLDLWPGPLTIALVRRPRTAWARAEAGSKAFAPLRGASHLSLLVQRNVAQRNTPLPTRPRHCVPWVHSASGIFRRDIPVSSKNDARPCASPFGFFPLAPSLRKGPRNIKSNSKAKAEALIRGDCMAAAAQAAGSRLPRRAPCRKQKRRPRRRRPGSRVRLDQNFGSNSAAWPVLTITFCSASHTFRLPATTCWVSGPLLSMRASVAPR